MRISWRGSFDTATNFQSFFINFLIPVKKDFTKADFFNWNGKIFPDAATPIEFSLSNVPDFISVSQREIFGTGKIYFVKAIPNSNGTAISGLFEGNIGDTIIVRKGRFDFYVQNLPF
jgi:hypothetical protein